MHHRAALLRAVDQPVDAADAGHHAVGRGVAHQVVLAAPAALGGDGQRAVFQKATLVAQVGDVFARGALALRVAARHGLGAGGVLREGEALLQALQVGPGGGGGAGQPAWKEIFGVFWRYPL
jgi:hypothetical protein